MEPIEEMHKKVIPDPLTGDFQTVYTNKEGTFMLCMPHKAIQMPEGWTPPPLPKMIKKEGNVTTWEYPKDEK